MSSLSLQKMPANVVENEDIYERPVIREQSEDQTYSRLQVNRMMTAETFPMSGMENTGTGKKILRQN